MKTDQARSSAADIFARLSAYALETKRFALRRPGSLRPAALIRHFPAWWSSLDTAGYVEDIPWMCFPAIEVMERWLRPEMRVFEWGSGGSTVFFSRRVSRVWSVEHDRPWHDQVRMRLDRHRITNCELRLVEPEIGAEPGGDPSDPFGHASGDARFPNASFARYVDAIADLADRSLDLVLVDGRARPACCRAAMAKVRVGGFLVLDNAEVAYYERARRLLDPREWALTEVWGPQPGLRHFSTTCLWKRRDAS